MGSPDTRPVPGATGAGRVPMGGMIDIVLVDDHPAVLAGLVGLVELEPGMTCRATATSAADALEAVRETRAGVVIADYELPDTDGLTLCADLKSRRAPPGVVVYSAFARPRLLPAAAIAGADAMLDKAAPADELFGAVREVARGEARLPAPSPEVMQRCLVDLDPDDLPLFGMAVSGMAPREIAEVVGVDLGEARRRLRVLLGRLQPEARIDHADHR
jgi:DNA-binding NarL/FixJ family response regulator